jgi:hypothetical protein
MQSSRVLEVHDQVKRELAELKVNLERKGEELIALAMVKYPRPPGVDAEINLDELTMRGLLSALDFTAMGGENQTGTKFR